MGVSAVLAGRLLSTGSEQLTAAPTGGSPSRTNAEGMANGAADEFAEWHAAVPDPATDKAADRCYLPAF